MQTDLASTLKENANCRIQIWNDLKGKLIDDTNPEGSQAQQESRAPSIEPGQKVPLSEFDEIGKQNASREAALRGLVESILHGHSPQKVCTKSDKCFHIGDKFQLPVSESIFNRNPKTLSVRFKGNLNETKYGDACIAGIPEDSKDVVDELSLKDPTVTILGFYQGKDSLEALVRYSISGTPMGTMCPSEAIFFQPL